MAEKQEPGQPGDMQALAQFIRQGTQPAMAELLATVREPAELVQEDMDAWLQTPRAAEVLGPVVAALRAGQQESGGDGPVPVPAEVAELRKQVARLRRQQAEDRHRFTLAEDRYRNRPPRPRSVIPYPFIPLLVLFFLLLVSGVIHV